MRRNLLACCARLGDYVRARVISRHDREPRPSVRYRCRYNHKRRDHVRRPSATEYSASAAAGATTAAAAADFVIFLRGPVILLGCERKYFFFEKKKQKTFCTLGPGCWPGQRPWPRVTKVFCRAPGGEPFFSKKRVLVFSSPALPHSTPNSSVSRSMMPTASSPTRKTRWPKPWTGPSPSSVQEVSRPRRWASSVASGSEK